MSIIKNIIGREILDSRGNPTVEADVILENGVIGRASVPSGASTGIKEACELRDNENRYNGKGVLKAVNNINTEIKNKLIGMEAFNQKEIDQILINLDGTENKSRLGANAILAVSMAVMKSCAKDKKIPLFEYIGSSTNVPNLMMNILNGGVHADNNIDFQEFMIVPVASTIHEKIRIGSEIFHSLKKILREKNLETSVGDEGGFAPNVKDNIEALDLIVEAIKSAKYIPGKDVFLALDIAASQLYIDGKYNLKSENKFLEPTELIKYYENLIDNYPIISIEDPVEESDFDNLKLITKKLGNKIQIVGDDLFVTNKKYLKKAIELKAGNAILIKPNQIGTITEMIQTIKLAKENNYKTIISHRSGETEDTTIADLAVGLNIGQIKTGSLSRGERTCKYNQLIRIEEYLKGK